MGFLDATLRRAFGKPTGFLGILGGRLMARMNRDVAAWVISLVDPSSDDRVLEIGFGPGVGIGLLARAVPEGLVAGIDPSSEMLEQAKRRNATAIGTGRIDLCRGVAANLPFDDDSFDSVLSINSLQVWSDPVTGLRELRRVLKRGGTVAIAFTSHADGPTVRLPDLLCEAGFTAVCEERRDSDVCVLATA